MAVSKGKLGDIVSTRSSYNRDNGDKEMVKGIGEVVVRAADGSVKQRVPFENLVTDRGDEYYAKRGAGASENAATGMRLGTGTTSPSKGGGGAAIGSYVTGSARAFDSAASTSDKGGGNGYRITYVTTWPEGEATADNISEVVVTNEDPVSNVSGTASNTISRALLSPTVNKGSGDTLEVTWHHDLLGS